MPTATTYHLNLNTYRNRRIIRYADFSDYQPFVLSYSEKINFNPNDGLTAELVVNKEPAEIGNYLIVLTGSSTIDSRWFVMEERRLRKGQYRLFLRRDIISDYYSSVMNSTCFIEKATLDKGDPFIFNGEDMTFNQIKKAETPIKDETKGAWIVGYVPRDWPETAQSIETGVSISGSQDFTAESGIDNFEYLGIKVSDYLYGRDGSRSFLPWTSHELNLVFTAQTRGYMDYQYYQGLSVLRTYVTWRYQFGYQGSPYATVEGIENTADIEEGTQVIDCGDNGGGTYVYISSRPTPDPATASAQFFSKSFYVDEIADPFMLSEISEVMESSGMILDGTTYSALRFLDGRIVYDALTGIRYKIGLVTTEINDRVYQAVEYGSNLWNKLWDVFDQYRKSGTTMNAGADATPANRSRTFYWGMEKGYIYQISLTQLPSEASLTIDKTRYILEDAPYDMFCIPYSENIEINLGSESYTYEGNTYSGNISIKGSESVSMQTAINIAAQLGTAAVYDVQLLPYCPARYLMKSDGTLSADGHTYDPITSGKVWIGLRKTEYWETDENDDPISLIRTVYDIERRTALEKPGDYGLNIGNATVISVHFLDEQADNTVSAVFWCLNSSFSFQSRLDPPITVTDPKVENLTDMYRLVSPNFSGTFEFSAAKNGGVSYFDVFCTYKPYNPYISVRPDFGGLYGSNFRDGRGLICGGDFSLPQISSAWADYELSNKNYQAIFDRQIANLEVKQDVARLQQKVSLATGAISAGLQAGAAAALATGGNPIAAIGAGLGNAAVGVGTGILDYQISETLRAEEKAYAIDMYSYNLQNIQAMPYSLSRGTAFNATNKIFPMLEYYSCTEEEKEALRQKMNYNGMTVMRIGTFSDYVRSEESFIQARLIRMADGADMDSHLMSAIGDELAKGVYI